MAFGEILMAIKKQEFYEGAALHLLARQGGIRSIRYQPPFFLINDRLTALLKYSTRGRSPWGFTFMPDEQALLKKVSSNHAVMIGLICGSDGVAMATVARTLACLWGTPGFVVATGQVS